MGEEKAYTIFGDKYRPIQPPICFFYIYSVFQELYNGCKEKITFQDIDCYSRLRRCNFSHYELDLIHKMNIWANEQIEELENEKDGETE